jgi:hypothetical protein
MKKIIILLLAISCANKVPTLRSSYQLGTIDDFLISNIYVNPEKVEEVPAGIKIKYNLIVKNLKTTTRTIDLSRSVIGNEYFIVPLKCLSFHSQLKNFKVEGKETFKIECEAVITKNSLHSGDSKLELAISLEKSAAIFKYLVRAEDFK